MVGMFEDSTQPKEWASRRTVCIWRWDTQGKFYGPFSQALGIVHDWPGTVVFR
jgi:hypothetical protein